MNIYLAHSSSFDYRNELYKPIKTSKLWAAHHIILPHDTDANPSYSKNIIETSDLIIAEVSYPSIGLGIELGFAHTANRPILCFYKKGAAVSTSVSLICPSLTEYTNVDELITYLEEIF